MEQDDVSGLTKLGSEKTTYAYDGPSAGMLETFPNPRPGREYEITHETKEFTSLCPKTGQPDFAEVIIRMVPKDVCVESKSLKLYLFAYRNHGAFMERIANQIHDDLMQACDPLYCRVVLEFAARGGLKTQVEVESASQR